MRRYRGTSNIHFYVPYHEYWSYKIVGLIGTIVLILITSAILYFPVIKPNIEQQKSIVAQVEKGNVDFTYGDVSEFSIHSNAYAQGQDYDGKVVSFTGRIGVIGDTSTGEYGDSVVSIYSDTLINEWCANCAVNDKSTTDLSKEFKKGDSVVVTGEVYHSSWVIELRNCEIEHAVNK